MLTEVHDADLGKQVEELLQINYPKRHTATILRLMLRGKAEKVIRMRIDHFSPVVMTLRRDSWQVSRAEPAHIDLCITIPLRDMMGLFMGHLPFRSALSGKLRFWGNPLDGLLLQWLLHVDVGDPESAYQYIHHYYLED